MISFMTAFKKTASVSSQDELNADGHPQKKKETPTVRSWEDVIRKHWKFLAVFIAPLIMFFPALTKFYTHDDFYFLKIAGVKSFGEFLNFFNLIRDIEGIGVYRPLTLRVYYFLSVELFNLNPIALRIISFITFFAVIFLVWKLIKYLTGNTKIALFSAFLYGVSVTHFGQLYYIGAFQELFLTAMFLASTIFFIKYEIGVKNRHRIRNLVASFIFYILAIMSKETAVVLPFILVLCHFYLKLSKIIKFPFKSLVLSLIPYLTVLGVYLVLHFCYFGTISGDSYVWNFSLSRATNTLVWYGLWSLNIPEMLVDFVGPGINLNPNLLKFWSKEIIPILVLFAIEVGMTIYVFIRSQFTVHRSRFIFLFFSISWFIATLTPVLFLPIHKFTYYLTLPLIGVVFLISYLFVNQKLVVRIIFCLVWLTISVLSLHLTLETNWITRGVDVSKRVYTYFNQNKLNFVSKNIVFVDTSKDLTLPWSPTTTLKTVLSDKNFFEVFYPGLTEKVFYDGLVESSKTGDSVIINSRQFLGY
jgi:hypothetical protein